jgi:hypothetical protein
VPYHDANRLLAKPCIDKIDLEVDNSETEENLSWSWNIER